MFETCALTRQSNRALLSRDAEMDREERIEERALMLSKRYREEDIEGQDGLLMEGIGEQLRLATSRRELAHAFHSGDWSGFGTLLANASADYIEARTRELAEIEIAVEDRRSAFEANCA